MKRKQYYILGLCSVGAGLLLLNACGKSQKTWTVEEKPLTEAVYASAKLVPDNEYMLYAMGEGYVLDIMVKEGDTVAPGQLIIRLQADAQDARLYAAMESMSIAGINASQNSSVIAELRENIGKIKSKLVIDSTNWKRYEALRVKNAISASDYEKAELAYTNTKKELNAANDNLETRQRQLNLEYQNSKSQYEVYRAEKGFYELRSLISGKVYAINKEKGEMVRRGETLAVIGDAGSSHLEMDVDELDIQKIQPGQKVWVSMDVFRDQLFEAYITKVYPQLRTADLSFRVDANFVNPLPVIYSGISAEANIIISEKENALVIPKLALVAEDTVNTPKGKMAIETGIENYEWVEVLSGLSAGDKVIIK